MLTKTAAILIILIIAVIAGSGYLATTAQASCTGTSSFDSSFAGIYVTQGFLSARITPAPGQFAVPAGSSDCLLGSDANIPFGSNSPFISYANMQSQFLNRPGQTVQSLPDGTVISTPLLGARFYHVQGNLYITPPSGSALTYTMPVVFFVDTNLYINGNINDNNNSNAGIVFVVRGNVYVNPSVSRVDAFTMTFGDFCDSYSNGSCSSTGSDTQLTINGSVISLGASISPQFVRYVAGTAAEDVEFQPKYLILYRDVFANDVFIWQELTN